MRSNKGYTLAELLISMAIFSIIMVSIVTVMRNVSISYRNENAEVQLQENSQLLLSQIEELLVDCDKLEGEGTVTNPYKITKYSGYNTSGAPIVGSVQQLKLVGNTVQYQYGTSGFEELANNVFSFDIAPAQSSNGDNRTTVTVSMINNIDGKDNGRQYTYTASKEIVFRNDVEKADVHNSSFLTSGGGGGGTTTTTTPNAINLEIGRYQIVNLVADYDIKPDTITLTQSGTAGFTFIKGGDDALEDGISDLEETSNKTPFFTTNSVCNSNTSGTYNCTLKAKTSTNSDITLNIKCPDVKLKKGSGVVYCPEATHNDGANKNFYSYIKVQGICVRDLKKYYGENCSGEMTFVNASSGSKGSGTIFASNEEWVNSKKYFKNTSDGNGTQLSGISGANQCKFGLAYDPFCDDVLCVMFSNGLNANPTNMSTGNYKVTIKFIYPSGTSTDSKSETYTLYTSGANLGNL